MDVKELITYANKELIEKGNLDVIQDVFTVDYIVHTDNKDYKGYDSIKKWVKQLRKAMPNMIVEKVEFFTNENNTIVWQRTLKGKHRNQMWGLRPSDKEIKWNEMVVSRLENDIIAEEWVVSEFIGKLLLKTPKT